MQGIIDMFTDPNFLHSSYKLNNYLVKQEIPVYQSNYYFYRAKNPVGVQPSKTQNLFTLS